jgi:hypothetical protein
MGQSGRAGRPTERRRRCPTATASGPRLRSAGRSASSQEQATPSPTRQPSSSTDRPPRPDVTGPPGTSGRRPSAPTRPTTTSRATLHLSDPAPLYGVPVETRCEKTDLLVAHCDHCQQRRHAPRANRVEWLEVSPTNYAHIPGCFHKGDDPDRSRWGEIRKNPSQAWDRLWNRDVVVADAGAQVGLEARRPCQHCVSGHL